MTSVGLSRATSARPISTACAQATGATRNQSKKKFSSTNANGTNDAKSSSFGTDKSESNPYSTRAGGSLMPSKLENHHPVPTQTDAPSANGTKENPVSRKPRTAAD